MKNHIAIRNLSNSQVDVFPLIYFKVDGLWSTRGSQMGGIIELQFESESDTKEAFIAFGSGDITSPSEYKKNLILVSDESSYLLRGCFLRSMSSDIMEVLYEYREFDTSSKSKRYVIQHMRDKNLNAIGILDI